MPKHEHLQELCAAASAGQASGAELAELREHLEWCSTCQERYAEFLCLNAAQYARNARDEELSREEAVGAIDSTLLRQRFLKKAAAEGIVFSDPRIEPVLPGPQVHLRAGWNWPMVFARAAASVVLVAAVGWGGYRFAIRQMHTPPPGNGPTVTLADLKAEAERLEKRNRDLVAEIASLRASLDLESSTLAKLQAHSASSERNRQELLSRVKEREDAMASLQARLDRAQNDLASIRADHEKAQSALSSSRTELAEGQSKIHALSEQLAESSAALARERDLLAAGRDVRDLMSARNLHIVDVFDVDPKGKKRPAFGRIFFTEGKSLLFYAYDLPDSRLKNAGYHYRIWGKKDGASQRVQSLGIFFSDDKAQRRWVFHYDDPKVLHEIDSIFVTVEPPDASPTQPKGDKLLYAFLKGPANHP